jgi:hypothetical protein
MALWVFTKFDVSDVIVGLLGRPCGLVGRYQCSREMSALKMEIVCFSEMLASPYKYTWCYYPEDKH